MGDDLNELFELHVELDGRTFTVDIRQPARIDPDPATLDAQLAEHPERYAHWATLEALARAKVAQLKADMALADGVLLEEYRQNRDDPVAQYTPGRKLERDAGHIGRASALHTATAQLDRLTVARVTMLVRQECLLALAANTRGRTAA